MVQNIADRQANTVLLAGQAVDRATVQGLKTASAKSGVSFQYLLAKAAQESSLNPAAQADSSSAAGLFQFTRGTWLDMLKRYGSQYGHADLSRQILETPSGKLAVTDDAAEKRILGLRNDPELSGLMAAEYARDNSAALEGATGHAPDAAELYLAHFLGASGASTLLGAPTSAKAAALLPAAAKANPTVFNGPDGHARSVGEVIFLIRSRFAGQLARYADAGTAATDATPVAPRAPAAPAQPDAGGSVAHFDMRNILSGNGTRSPAQMMMLDQLLRVIASDPMEASNEESPDGMQPLSSGGLKGSDWADAMSRHLVPTGRTPAARRAYAEPSPGPQALNHTL